MGKALAGPRVLRKTAAEIAAIIDNHITSLSDDYTVNVRVNGEDCPTDSFTERATPNASVHVDIVHDTEPDNRRLEAYCVIAATAPRGDGLATAEVAQTFREYNNMAGKLMQTVADLNNVVQEQTRGQLAMAKAMQKSLKIATKAIKKSAKDRKKAETATGFAGSVGELLKDVNSAVGPERTTRLLEQVIAASGGLLRKYFGPDGAGAGGAAPAPADAANGAGDGEHAPAEGESAPPRDADLPNARGGNGVLS